MVEKKLGLFRVLVAIALASWTLGGLLSECVLNSIGESGFGVTYVLYALLRVVLLYAFVRLVVFFRREARGQGFLAQPAMVALRPKVGPYMKTAAYVLLLWLPLAWYLGGKLEGNLAKLPAGVAILYVSVLLHIAFRPISARVARLMFSAFFVAGCGSMVPEESTGAIIGPLLFYAVPSVLLMIAMEKMICLWRSVWVGEVGR